MPVATIKSPKLKKISNDQSAQTDSESYEIQIKSLADENSKLKEKNEGLREVNQRMTLYENQHKAKIVHLNAQIDRLKEQEQRLIRDNH